MRFKPFIFLLFISIASFAQSPIKISGRVLDEQSNSPVEFATVALFDSETRKPISGTTTIEDGTFLITSKSENIFIEISFIGFINKTITEFEIQNNKIDLGTISLKSNSKQLEEVIVEGEKSSTEFRIDKRVFNVGSDLSNAGGSALDILANIPSVNVNIEGLVSLRGTMGVQILINGKPSVLTASDNGNALGSITASMIESVEVITNPSAKYEAEGTAGIINIILKKEENRGTNGSVTFNTGVPHNHSIGLSLNHRTEKFNLFSQLGAGYRELPNDIKSRNDNFTSNKAISTIGEEFRNESFYNVILGTDYYLNDYNVITLSGNYTLEIEDQPSLTNYTLSDENASLIESEWQRDENTGAINPKYQFDLQYKRKFRDFKEHVLIYSITGSYFGKTQSSDFFNKTISGITDRNLQQKTATSYEESKYTFKLDYIRPLSKDFTVEMGGQYLLNDVGNDYSVESLLNQVWVLDTTQTNLFEYSQNVLGVYSTASYEKNRWGLKLGLRVENTDLSTLLTNTNESNYQNYTNFFPTIHTSYKVSQYLGIQGGYSRRVYRPRLWDLNPFFNIRDNFNIRQGNPNLLPEFTDSYEFGMIFNGKSFSVSSYLYHRYTSAVIERISTFVENINTTMPENIGTNKATGLELNTKYDPVKWISLSADFNFNYFDRYGELFNKVFDFTANQSISNLRVKFKLPADFDFELIGNYLSGYQTVQGEVSAIAYLDLGLKKKIIDGKGVINFSIRDVFASRVEERFINQTDFSLYNRSLRGRFITLGFSYGFGKGEAMTYSGGHR